MSDKVQVRFRSDAERLRYRIDVLEKNILEEIERINQIEPDNPEIANANIDYLRWYLTILKNRRINNKGGIKQLTIKENKCNYFKEGYGFPTVNTSEIYNFNHFSTGFNKQPIIGYSSFLENGLKVYIKYIDTYRLWITPEDAHSLLTKEQGSLVSYAFLAVLARFTLSKKQSIYKNMYFKCLKDARLCIPNAYQNPNCENIIGLVFLCFVAMSYYNTKLCIRYFSCAVRMAQMLGYDKSEQIEAMNDKQNTIRNDGKKVWKYLSMVYFSFSTFIPNMPNLNANFEPVVLDYPLLNSTKPSQANEIKDVSVSTNSIEYSNNKSFFDEKKQIECMSGILAHIQRVKNNYKSIELIPYEELRLPPNKFNEILSILISQDISEIIKQPTKIGIEDNKTELFNLAENNLIKYKLDISCQLNITFLYYPSVLVYPKPIRFIYHEACILIKAAAFVIEFYIKVYKNKNPNDIGFKSSLSCTNSSLENQENFHLASSMPYYTQIVYPLYIYFNFISERQWFIEQGIGGKVIQNIQLKCLDVLNMLKHARGSNIKNEAKDATNTLNTLYLNMSNFDLPEDFRSENDSVCDFV